MKFAFKLSLPIQHKGCTAINGVEGNFKDSQVNNIYCCISNWSQNQVQWRYGNQPDDWCRYSKNECCTVKRKQRAKELEDKEKSVLLCKVDGYIVRVIFTRLLYVIFYYEFLGLIILEFFLFILPISVFTSLHNYHSPLDSLTLKTHT